MVVGSFNKGCQVAVIGSGPGGYLAAIRLAQLKKDVILIEREQALGGICLNVGCIPSKALLHAADFLMEAQHADRMGIAIPQVSVDMGRLVQWKDTVVKRLTDGIRFLTDKYGVQTLQGTARFVSDRRLEVAGAEGAQLVDFEQAVIATGSSPRELKEIPFDGKTVIGSTEALSLKEIPKRMVILGAGYIGLEMASLYVKLGTDVTIVEPLSELLPLMDKEVGEAMSLRLKALGVKFMMGMTPVGFLPGPPAVLKAKSADGAASEYQADVILVSVGRVPNSKGLGLETAGVALDGKGFIKVDHRMATTVSGLYAIGDVVGGPLLAHKAYREAKVAAEIIAGQRAEFDNIVIPAAIYTDPEIAWAGLGEKEALQKGLKVITGSFPFRASGRALTLNAPDGFVKSIADARTKKLLGVVMVGRGVSELISEAALAMEMGAFLDDLQQTIHPHPTMSEALLESVDAALGEAVHVLPQKSRA